MKTCNTQVVLFSAGQNTQSRYLKATQAFARDIPSFAFDDQQVANNFSREPLAIKLDKNKKVKIKWIASFQLKLGEN